MNKKLYQQPKTLTIAIESCAVICATSPGGGFINTNNDPLTGGAGD